MASNSQVILLGERDSARPRPKGAQRKTGRFALVAVSLLIFAFLYVPILVLIVFSFNSARSGAVWQGFSLVWYERMFGNSRIIEAAATSLLIAVLSTAGAVVIGTLMALAMERYQFKGKAGWDGLLYMPVIIPEIVAGTDTVLAPAGDAAALAASIESALDDPAATAARAARLRRSVAASFTVEAMAQGVVGFYADAGGLDDGRFNELATTPGQLVSRQR